MNFQTYLAAVAQSSWGAFPEEAAATSGERITIAGSTDAQFVRGLMVVGGKQTSHESSGLCHGRGNPTTPRTDPFDLPILLGEPIFSF